MTVPLLRETPVTSATLPFNRSSVTVSLGCRKDDSARHQRLLLPQSSLALQIQLLRSGPDFRLRMADRCGIIAGIDDLKRDFATTVTGALFIIAALLLWAGGSPCGFPDSRRCLESVRWR